ncbi:unnamed protein product [Urochloa humidicola]
MSDQTTTGRRSSPLDDDDLLGEIILRVSQQPSTLPRISLVCKRWCHIVSDPWFHRRFCAHHVKAPLLGFFEQLDKNFLFNPIMEPPDHIPPQRFSLGRALTDTGPGSKLLLRGCRHGRVIVTDISSSSSNSRNTVFVCDPVTGAHNRLVVPEEFPGEFMNGTVVCASGEDGHVHGACQSSPFKVVIVSMSRNDSRAIACVYSSETGVWGNTIRHGDHQCKIVDLSSTLIAGALYYKMLYSKDHDEEHGVTFMPKPGLLKFDLDKQSMDVLKGPPTAGYSYIQGRIIKTVDDGVGFTTLRDGTMQLQVWHSNVNCHGVATWVLFKTVDLYNIFRLQEHQRWPSASIMGYDEDAGEILICLDSSLFLLQLDSMQCERRFERTERRRLGLCYPFRSFYTAGDS